MSSHVRVLVLHANTVSAAAAAAVVLTPWRVRVCVCVGPNTTQVASLVAAVNQTRELHFQRMMEVSHREWLVKPPYTVHPSPYQTGALFTAFIIQILRVSPSTGFDAVPTATADNSEAAAE